MQVLFVANFVFALVVVSILLPCALPLASAGVGGYTNIRANTRTYIHSYSRTYAHSYIRTDAHTYIRTYIHSYVLFLTYI